MTTFRSPSDESSRGLRLAAAAGLSFAACGGAASQQDSVLSGESAPTTVNGPGSNSSTESTSSTQSPSSASTTAGPNFDLAGPADAGPNCADPEPGQAPTMFSFLWVANSPAGTLSKIDTQAGVEQARYLSSPDPGGGSPSRTSVNLLGDVAVSNREPGGVTKIAADPSRCRDRNSDGALQTSSGPNDVLPWMEDECVLWHRPLPTALYNYGARPTAWEGGSLDEDGCVDNINPRLWVGYKDELTQRGMFVRIDGSSGEIVDTVEGPVWTGVDSKGPYGGAVNAQGDFIVTGLNYGNVVVIDSETLELTEIEDVPQDKYGMGLDAHGNLWVGGFEGNVHTYDFDAQVWTTLASSSAARINGVTVDRDGTLWGARSEPCGLIVVDTGTATIVEDLIALPGCGAPWGISTDIDGFVWVVDTTANLAFKVDPVTRAVELSVTGLEAPYTYSDMTGAGLNLVVNPPG